MSLSIAETYQKTADVMRRAAVEKLGPKDPARNLLQLAASQLENAADTARLLEQITIEGRGATVDTRNIRPSNSGQWEGDKQAEISSAFRGGMICGALIVAMLWLVVEVIT